MPLNTPHGGTLVNLILDQKDAKQLKNQTLSMPSWDLSDRQLCDLELLLNGGFSPLTGFMNKSDYDSVLKDMRLSDGSLWPMRLLWM